MKFLYILESARTPFWNSFFQTVTHCGGEYVFLVLAIVIFWCLSKKCGYYMLTVGFVGITINQFLKILCRIPRPWVRDPNFTIVESARADAGGYSFPSGHTQNLFAVFGAPARYTKSLTIRIIAIILICLTAFSRMYLGCHTPADVGVSIIIGLILVFALYPIFENMDKNPKAVYMTLIVFCALTIAFVIYLEATVFPADIDADNLAEAFKYGYMMAFCSFALLISYHVDRKYTKFDTEAVWWAQILKVLLGLIVVMGIKILLKAPLITLLNGHSSADGIRYGLMVLFAGCIWPMTFKWFSKLGKN